MQRFTPSTNIDLNDLGRTLRALGAVGHVSSYAAATKTLLVSTSVAAEVSIGEQGDTKRTSEKPEVHVIASGAKQSLPEKKIASSPPAPRNDSSPPTSRVFSKTDLVITNYLFGLGVARSTISAIRRVTSLVDGYREHLLDNLCIGLKRLPDDKALADTLERLDHLSAELLARLEAQEQVPSPLAGEGQDGGYLSSGSTTRPLTLSLSHKGRGDLMAGVQRKKRQTAFPLSPSPTKEKEALQSLFSRWNAEIWQAPDAITFLAKVVDTPDDFPQRPAGPQVAVGFDWLSWDTPPAIPAPAPWGDREPLRNPLTTTRHPFWGAIVATLDACTGDYEWQSLMLRGGILRSRHRALGKAEELLRTLWSHELGLYPAPPFVLSEDITFIPGKPFPWLQPALEHLADAGVATQVEGSWRLTDAFRTQLMKDDEHMLTFEAVRKRSYRLARAAEQMTEHPLTLNPLPQGGEGI